MIKTLSNEFMQKIATEKAWEKLSEDFNWSETLLEKYQDKVDWKWICRQWTIPMIQKFKNRIDWDEFSEQADGEILTEAVIEAFKDKWNWLELSKNDSLELTHELLEKYADSWNWENIIDRYNNNLFGNKGVDFYEKYKDRIPAAKLQDSMLWREIVEQRVRQLKAEITG